MAVFQDIASMDRILYAIFAHENKSQGMSAPFVPTHKCRRCRAEAEWRNWNGFTCLQPAGALRRTGRAQADLPIAVGCRSRCACKPQGRTLGQSSISK